MMTTPKHFTKRLTFIAGLYLGAVLVTNAGTITKANNAVDLAGGSSWVGGIAPTSADVALWNSTVTGPNAASLGADVSWQGIQILNPNGSVTIDGANVLSLGGSGINMASALADLTLATTMGGSSIHLSADQSWNIGGGRTLTINPSFSVQNGRVLTLAGGGNLANSGVWQVGAAGSTGTIQHLGGIWSSGQAGTVLHIGYSDTVGNPGLGIYNLDSGTISLSGSQEIRLGSQTSAATGTLSITNGTIASSTTTTLLRVGFANGSMGTLNQVGGAVTIGQIDCAALNGNAVGTVNLMGGALNTTKLNAGNLPGAKGSIIVTDGALSITNSVNLGALGNGSITISNTGWLNIYGPWVIGSGFAGSSGTLNLNGGILNVCSNTATLTVGSRGVINANGGGISNGSIASITISAPIKLGAGGLTLVPQAVTHNITVSGQLSGAGGLTSSLGGGCNTYLTGSNIFTGPLTITSGYFHNPGTYAVPIGCNVTNNAQWGMDKGVTLGSFGGSGGIFRDSGQGSAILTVGHNNADGHYSGSINEGTGSQLALTKIGLGSFTLGGNCSYTGNTTVSNGTLLVNGTLRASYVDVRGGALGGGGIISNSVNFAAGTAALFSDTTTLSIAGSLIASGHTIQLSLSTNVPAGYYLLATCADGAIGAFDPTPVITSGSFAPGTTNYFISTPNDRQIWLVVQNQNPSIPVAGQFDWPNNQFLPTFPPSADLIDVIDCSGIGGPLSDLFASLQGIVNRSQPRIMCVSSAAEEGKLTWLQDHYVSYRYNSGYNLLGQYIPLFSGLVVTDPDIPDTINLATTIAGVTNGLICDPSLLDLLTSAPYSLPIVVDLRGMFANKYQVYGYLYSNYWSQCTQRIIAGLQPGNHGNLRDYCVAVKAACVWLNPGSVAADATALAPFVSSMKPAGGVWMGWLPNENNDVAWLSQYGIPVLASDYYLNGSLFSGVHLPIEVPPIPPAPPLQNKIYVCFFLSDGDNIAFMQHKMRNLWKDSARGSVPIGWTTSPLACDIDPGMLSYYWSTATTNDCLVSGPSGAGYAKIEHWSAANAIAFAAASAPYLQEGGQSVITVWDSLSTANGRIYGTNCPALAGLIDHGGGYYTTTGKGNIPAMGLVSGANYAGSVASLIAGITNTAASWSGTAPMFIPVQGSGWDITPSELLTVASALDSRFVVVRPDTLFLLYRQSRGQPVVLDPAPANLRAVRRFNGTIALTWTGSTDASRYKIARSTSSGGETIIATTVASVFTDTEVDENTTYYYQVATENLVGLSPFSIEIVVPAQAPIFGTYATAMRTAAPLAYWPLNETSGVTALDWANGYDGTYTGGYSLGLLGIPNGGQGLSGSYGAYFDGASGKVVIPNDPFNLTNALTIMAWVKVTNTPSHFSGVVGRGDNSWRMSVNTSGRPGGNAAHIYSDATGPTSIMSTNWRMLTYTYSGAPDVPNNGLLFVDGVPVVTNTVGAFAGSSLDVWIGGSPDYGNSRIMQGGIAQVAVFTNALPPSQVFSLYNTGVGNLPSLSLKPSSTSNLQLTWSGGTLLQATNLGGPWTTNAWTSPSIVAPTNAQMFFRLE